MDGKRATRRPTGIDDDRGFESVGITDDLMFKRVFGTDPALAGGLLSCVLDREVGEVEYVGHGREVAPEPDSHATTFDVYLRTREGALADLEMQTAHRAELPLRLRAHLSNIDREAIARGSGYADASESYVIFICTFDPLGEGRKRYTVERTVRETGGRFPDRQTGVLLFAGGTVGEVPAGLDAFLGYVAGYDGGEEIGDDFVREVDERVRATRSDWKWRRSYMTLEERIADAREEEREKFAGERKKFTEERERFAEEREKFAGERKKFTGERAKTIAAARRLVAEGRLGLAEASGMFGIPVSDLGGE